VQQQSKSFAERLLHTKCKALGSSPVLARAKYCGHKHTDQASPKLIVKVVLPKNFTHVMSYRMQPELPQNDTLAAFTCCHAAHCNAALFPTDC
jgi:hypothetical protein